MVWENPVDLVGNSCCDVWNVKDQDAQPAEPLPRVLPEIKDPNVAKRNRRMFGSLLGTLEVYLPLIYSDHVVGTFGVLSKQAPGTRSFRELCVCLKWLPQAAWRLTCIVKAGAGGKVYDEMTCIAGRNFQRLKILECIQAWCIHPSAEWRVHLLLHFPSLLVLA